MTSSTPVSGLSPSKDPGSITNPVIVARDLQKVYGRGSTRVAALNGVDLEVSRGQLTAIMGPSGSGKSTLMHLLAGLDSATSGTVLLEGSNITALDERRLTKLRRDRVGFIFQAYNLVPTLTAEENITLPVRIAGGMVNRSHLEAIVGAVGVGDYLSRLPGQLSGGQQQRVACARAMITTPAVIFADEPTGNLDSLAGRQVLSLLRRSVDELGQTVVMVTHDPWAASAADRIIFLSDGELVGELNNPTAQATLAALQQLGEDAEGDLAVEPSWHSVSADSPTSEEDAPIDLRALDAPPPLEPPEQVEEVPELQPQNTSFLVEVAEGEDVQAAALTLDEIAQPAQISAEAAEVIDQARQILDKLGGSVLETDNSEATYPQIPFTHDKLES